MRDVSVPIKKAWLNFIRAVSGVKLPVFTLINDADVHGVGVQVNATVELVLLVVELHRVFS